MELREESKRFLNDYFKKYLKLEQNEINEILKKRLPLRSQAQPRQALGPSSVMNKGAD
jgi:hypothetical protein